MVGGGDRGTSRRKVARGVANKLRVDDQSAKRVAGPASKLFETGPEHHVGNSDTKGMEEEGEAGEGGEGGGQGEGEGGIGSVGLELDLCEYEFSFAAKLVEVKGPNDTLMDRQTAWLAILRNAGIGDSCAWTRKITLHKHT